jgi:hypothetical protein
VKAAKEGFGLAFWIGPDGDGGISPTAQDLDGLKTDQTEDDHHGGLGKADTFLRVPRPFLSPFAFSDNEE